jgi:hypothetical protein
MALIATFLKYMNAATGHACYGTAHLLLALERREYRPALTNQQRPSQGTASSRGTGRDERGLRVFGIAHVDSSWDLYVVHVDRGGKEAEC